MHRFQAVLSMSLRVYTTGGGGGGRPLCGRAVQVDPIKPRLKAPGTKRLKLTHDEPLSINAFKFNLRRYSVAGQPPPHPLKLGRAVQVDSVKPTLKPPGSLLLKLRHDGALSHLLQFCFQIQLAPLQLACPGPVRGVRRHGDPRHRHDGKGLHSSSFPAQPEPFVSQNNPNHPILPHHTPYIHPEQPLNAPRSHRKRLRSAEECKPLHEGQHERKRISAQRCGSAPLARGDAGACGGGSAAPALARRHPAGHACGALSCKWRMRRGRRTRGTRRDAAMRITTRNA